MMRVMKAGELDVDGRCWDIAGGYAYDVSDVAPQLSMFGCKMCVD